MCTGPQDGCVSGGVEVCTGLQDGCVSGEVTFSIDVKGGENFLGRGVMIAGGEIVYSSMAKGVIFYQWCH